jgi:hypothetical protein
MLASLGYAGDNHGYLPYPNWASMDSTYKGAGWLYQPTSQPLSPDQLKTSVLWPWVKNARIFQCLLDQGPFQPGSSHLLSSYIMNGAVCGFGHVPPPAPSFQLRHFRPDAVIFIEADESKGAGEWNDGANNPSEGTTVRHNRGSCVAVIDGHVDWLNASNYSKQLALSPGPLWCSPLSSNGH